MPKKKSMSLPVVITAIIIIIIIYLFVNIEQNSVICTKKTTDDLGIQIEEKVNVSLDGRKIKEMKLTKSIILPEKYIDVDRDYLNAIQYSIKNSYEYLGKGKVKFSKLTDRLIVYVDAKGNDTLILDNIEFYNNDDLGIKINTNTKSNEVVTLKINDNYTEGALMVHLRNNGFRCK